MKITKEYFKQNLEALAKSYEVTDDLEQSLKLFFGYTPTVTFMDDLRSAYEKLLKNVCECEDAPDIFFLVDTFK